MRTFSVTSPIRKSGYFDVGNVVIFSYPEHWIELLSGRIVKVHVKDFNRSGWNAGSFVNLLEGSVDWGKVMNALRTAGYDGYLTAEVGALPASPDFLYQTTSLEMCIRDRVRSGCRQR